MNVNDLQAVTNEFITLHDNAANNNINDHRFVFPRLENDVEVGNALHGFRHRSI